jgi:hypothetical protein
MYSHSSQKCSQAEYRPDYNTKVPVSSGITAASSLIVAQPLSGVCLLTRVSGRVLFAGREREFGEENQLDPQH